MAAVYPDQRLIVMQMPKTGCIWRIHALHNAGLGRPLRVTLPPEHDARHATLHQIPDEYVDYRKIGCVRHPIEWLRSWWMMRMQRRNWHDTWPTWRPNVNLDRDCRSDDFYEFVEKILDRYRGFVTQLTFDYIGESGRNVDFVCRQESLAEDLRCALDQLEIPHDKMALLKTPTANTGRGEWRDRAELSESITQRVLESEVKLISTFYADSISRKPTS